MARRPEAPEEALYPLHVAVFENDVERLRSLLEEEGTREQMNAPDPHGRAPIMLATVLDHVECAELLLRHGADANTQSKDNWSLSHEAVSLGNPGYLRKVLTARDFQRAVQTSAILKELRESLKNAGDFYVEMSWQFTSWLPLVRSMCPSDNYKIYKSGSTIRIDSTLLALDNAKWRRGKQSFIFRFTDDANAAEVVFVDYEQRSAYVQAISLDSAPLAEQFEPSEDAVADKLLSPITTTYIDVERVGFERSKASGILSWIGSSDKDEDVEGYTCRVFNASNVEIVTRTRVDHLRDDQRQRLSENESKPLSFLMSLFEKKRSSGSPDASACASARPDDLYGGMTASQYLNAPSDERIGRPRSEVVRSNAFAASLWLAESFPLDLREQMAPIIDLMSVRNAKFSRLKSFMKMQLPSGFPVRISIPLFHMINAQVTFRHVNEPAADEQLGGGLGEEVDEQGLPVFRLDARLFEVPDGFAQHTTSTSLLFDNAIDEAGEGHPPQGSASRRYNAVDVEDDYTLLLERFMADERSGDSPDTSNYRQQLQLAIEQSIAMSAPAAAAGSSRAEGGVENEDELAKALEISKQEADYRQRLEEQEEEELRRALELSKIVN